MAKVMRLDGLVISQPIGEFYVVVMSPRQLTKIARADVRHLDDRELDSYLGIQRNLDKKRVNEIKEYVKTMDATFPIVRPKLSMARRPVGTTRIES